ncbi:glutamate receptor ionotropic, delta-1-like [Littorina saxatilis]|uniref:glutamate receptor ionotropic, delta-1-like n=1 Tax=Littorina saxatilis TaxID=31220 RepID=UPI0038B63441
MTWLVLGVILTSLYSSQLTSSLTVNQQDLPFTSLAELLDQDTYKFGIAAGTAQYSMLKNSTVKDYRRYYQKVLEFAKEDPDVVSSDILVHKFKAIHEDYASLQGSMLLSSAWLSDSCGQLTFLPEKLRTASFGFYLQKGSPYTRIISEQIGLMVDSGLMTMWKRSSVPENKNCRHGDDHSGRVIGLANTQTAFFMAAFGLGLALMVLAVEKLVRVISVHTGCGGS